MAIMQAALRSEETVPSTSVSRRPGKGQLCDPHAVMQVTVRLFGIISSTHLATSEPGESMQDYEAEKFRRGHLRSQERGGAVACTYVRIRVSDRTKASRVQCDAGIVCGTLEVVSAVCLGLHLERSLFPIPPTLQM